MFNRCYKLIEIKGLNNWNTSNIEDMNTLFSELKPNIGFIKI